MEAYDYPRVVEALERAWRHARDHREVAVVLVRSPCVIYSPAERGRPVRVVEETCVGCGVCAQELECPAISMEGDKARVEPSYCFGCGVCLYVCPVGAIVTG